jgi:hypothetical protein
MEGYVFKWLNFLKGWKPRYLVVESHTIYISNKKDDNNNKEKIELTSAKIIDEKKKKNFLIETPHNKFYFKTNTENEKIMWFNYLTEAIAKINSIKQKEQIEELQSPHESIKEFNSKENTTTSINRLNINFSESYKAYQVEIEKNQGDQAYGALFKNVLTMQNLLFEYSHSMEQMNYYILNKKKKDSHPLVKIYEDLSNIKYELKVNYGNN